MRGILALLRAGGRAGDWKSTPGPQPGNWFNFDEMELSVSNRLCLDWRILNQESRPRKFGA